MEQTEAVEAGAEVDEQAEVGETEEEVEGQDSQSIVQEPEEGDPETEGNCESLNCQTTSALKCSNLMNLD